MRYLLLLFLVPTAAFAVPQVPSVPGGFEPGLTVRAFKDIQPFTLMAEVGALRETDDRNYDDVTLGSYIQLTDHWSTGLFYRRAYGLRHDDDWITTNGVWSWQDTNSRGEDFLIADVSDKYEVFDNTVFEIKLRYLNNLFNQNQILLVRPGLTYFWLKDEQPFMNFFAQVEFDFPLNYDDEELDERWIYLGALYRVSEKIDVGGFYALHWQAWHSSSDYLFKNGAPYTISATSNVLSALAIFHF